MIGEVYDPLHDSSIVIVGNPDGIKDVEMDLQQQWLAKISQHTIPDIHLVSYYQTKDKNIEYNEKHSTRY